jgi:predicted Zn finger-like uncharacterized protein
MIVKCPSCSTRFRLDREKLAGKRVTLRCTRCRTPFRADLPRDATPVPLTPPPDDQVRVVIAHSDRELCGTIRSVVESAGFSTILGHTGSEVLALMDELRPQVALVDVALEGLYAFEVVEKVRRRPGLDRVKIILLSSVYNKAAYKRSPNSLYGADDYIEKHHIPDDLVIKINRLLVGAAPTESPADKDGTEQSGERLNAVEEQEQSLSFINTVNEKIQSAEAQEVSAGDQPEMARAERLARIIVSDISLYYQDRVDEGILHGNWSDLLASEIREARRLFSERFPQPEIQNSKILEAAFLDLLEKRRGELNA